MNAKKLFLTFFLLTIGWSVESQNIFLLGGDLPANGVQMTTSDNVNYTLTNVNLSAAWAKFRQGSDWTVNWGANNFPTGTGVQDGPDINVSPAGVYNVTFNRTTGAYDFKKVISADKDFDPYASAIYLNCSKDFCGKFSNVTTKDFGTINNVDLSAQKNAIEPNSGNWADAMFMRDYGAYNFKSGILKLKGAEVKTKITSAANVCKSVLHYKINNLTSGVNGSFSGNNLDLPFYKNCASNQYEDFRGPCLSGGTDKWQKWQKLDYNIDLTDRNEGNYELEVYFSLQGSLNGSCTDNIAAIGSSASAYKATFTICPLILGSFRNNPTTCGVNGSIVLTVQGIDDGVYNDRFFYNTNSVFTGVIVSTSQGVTTATIPNLSGSQTGVTYTNVRYRNLNVSGCSDIIAGNFTLTEPLRPSLPPVSGGNQTVCETSPIQTLTAKATVPNDQTVRWYSQAIGGTEVSPTLNTLETKSYFAEAVSKTSTCTSATRTEVILRINAAPIFPELKADDSDRTQCESKPIQTLNANNSILNKPPGFTVKWYNALTNGAEVASPILNSVGEITYYAVLKNDVTACESNTRIPVKLTILGSPVKPTVVSGGIHTDCALIPIQTLKAGDYVNEIPNFSIVWFSDAAGNNPVASPTLNTIGTVTYYAAYQNDVSKCIGNDKVPVVLTLNATPSTPKVATDCTLGFGKAVATVTSPTGTEYEYSINNGLFQTSTVFNNVPNGSNSITVRNKTTLCTSTSTSANDSFPVVSCGCALSTTLSLDPTSDNTCVSESFTVTNVMFGGSATRVDVTTDGAGSLSLSSSSIKPFNVVYTPVASDAGKTINITFKTDDPDGPLQPCEPSSQVFQLKVNSLPIIPTVLNGGIQTQCATNPIQTLDAKNSIDFTPGFSVKWYTDAVGGTEVLNPILNTVSSVKYYAALVNNTSGCEGSDRAEVTLTINDANTPTTTDAFPKFCLSDDPKIKDIKVNESGITWYDLAIGGNVLPDTTLLTDGFTYYASQTLNGCASSVRLAVKVTVGDTPAPKPIDETNPDLTQVFCGLDSPTVVSLKANGTNLKWYLFEEGGIALPSTTILSDNTIYYGTQTAGVGGCESDKRLAIPVNLECKILAVDDTVSNVNGLDGTKAVVNVLENDLLNGKKLNPNDVILAQSIVDPLGVLTLNPDGTVDVKAGTPMGTYTLEYSICEKTNTTNCDTALVTINVTPLIDVAILKKISNASPQVGDTITFTLTVTNNGIDTANNVNVKEQLPSGYTYISHVASTGTFNFSDWQIGSLLPKASVTLTIDAIVLAAGTYLNTATVSATEPDPILANNTDSDGVGNAKAITDLSIIYTVDNPKPYIGNVVTFTITVTNSGPSDGTGVVVKNTFPSGYVNVVTPSATTQGSYDNATGVWTIGNVPSGTSVTLTIIGTVRAIADGETNAIYDAEAVVTGVETESRYDNNRDVIDTNDINPIQQANIAATVNVVESVGGLVIDNSKPKVGKEIIFQIFVENAGPSIATGVVLTNTLPSGYTIKDSFFTEGSGVFDPATNKWIVGTLSSGSRSPLLYIVATVNATGSYTEAVDVIGDVLDVDTTNNHDEVTPSPIAQTDVEIVKTADVMSPPVESNVIFTLKVTNKGPSAATGVVSTDKLPTGYTYVSHTSGENYNFEDGKWTIGNMLSGETKTLEITALVKATGVYRNEASVGGTEEETFPTNNTSEVTPIPVPSANLRVVKTTPSSSGTVKLHENVVYTIKVTNGGQSDATGVLVTEKLPKGLTYLSSSATQGTYNAGTQIWTVGDIVFPGEATLTLVAIVNGEAEVMENTVLVKGNEGDPDKDNDTSTVTVTYEKDCELKIYNYVSANNDGYNDYFIIENIDCYPDNTVQIYNRWGVQVYQSENYGTNANSTNVFKGISEGRATISQDKTLPEGTYFYIVNYKGLTEEGNRSGYLELTR